MIKNKELLDFLLYSYFGCDSNEIKQAGIQKCANRAYLDLSRRIDFYYSTSELDNMSKKGSSKESKSLAKKYKSAKKDLIKKICGTILCPVEGCKCIDEEFELWHELKCKNIMKTMNNSTFQDGKLILKDCNAFTYGLAQKWINMTLKYLWLLDMLPDGLSEMSLHVPIDSFIIQALYNKVDQISNDNKYKGKAWSKFGDYKIYRDLQDEIKRVVENIPPIKWEESAWRKIAKKRNNQ